MSEPPSLRLEFELDSEVYPELHAALSALRSPQARAERLRQLASAGLVWEKVRIHGAVATGIAQAVPSAAEVRPVAVSAAPATAPPMRAEVAAPLVVPTIPMLAVEPSARASERRPASSGNNATAGSASGKRSRASAAEKRRLTDFVDLGIDAEPPAPTSGLPSSKVAASAGNGNAWPSQQDVERLIKTLPVLNDVVDDEETQHGALVDAHVPSSSAALHALSQEEMSGDDLAPMSSDEDGDSAGVESANDEESVDQPEEEAVMPVATLAQKPQARSRLMRMKERGLFKNG